MLTEFKLECEMCSNHPLEGALRTDGKFDCLRRLDIAPPTCAMLDTDDFSSEDVDQRRLSLLGIACHFAMVETAHLGGRSTPRAALDDRV